MLTKSDLASKGITFFSGRNSIKQIGNPGTMYFSTMQQIDEGNQEEGFNTDSSMEDNANAGGSRPMNFGAMFGSQSTYQLTKPQ
jgi:hypothetical protein